MTDEPSAQHAALAAALEAGDEPDEALAARLRLAVSEVAAARAARGALGGLLAAPGLAPALGAGVRVGRLELRSLLGRGGMGEVWRAWDPQAEREVALKLLRLVPGPAERARFEAEGQAAARLRHPGIVTVHEAGTTAEGRPYLVLELVDGESLATALRRRGPLAVREAASLGRDLARALDHAHARGVLHRDVKPANVLVGRDGRARLVDFGLARDLLRERLTATGTIVGTPAYMAPEQAAGRPIDARSDVWGLGATLVAALTGAPPPAPAGAIADRSLAELVGRCLTPDPAGRPASAGAVADALERWLAGEPTRSPGPRRALAAAALALAAVGLGALAGQPAPEGPAAGHAPVDPAKARRALEAAIAALEAELAGGPTADLGAVAAAPSLLAGDEPTARRARGLAERALAARSARAADLEVDPGARHPLQVAQDLARRLGLDLAPLARARVDALAGAPWARRIPDAAARGDPSGVAMGLERLQRAAGQAPPLPLELRADLAARLRSAAWEAAGERLATPEVTRAFLLLEDGLFYDLAPVGSASPAVEALSESYFEVLRSERGTITAAEAMAWARAGMYETNPGLWRTCNWIPAPEWARLASRPAASARLLEAAKEMRRFEAYTPSDWRRLAELLARVVEAPVADLPPVSLAWVWVELGDARAALDDGPETLRAGRTAAALLREAEGPSERRHPSDDGRGLVNLLGRALGLVVRGTRRDGAACLAAVAEGEALIRERRARAAPMTGAERAAAWTLGRYLCTVGLVLPNVRHPDVERVERTVLAELDRLADGDLDLVDDLAALRADRLKRRVVVDPEDALAEAEAAWTTGLRSSVRAAHEQGIDREVLGAGVRLCEAAAAAATRAGDEAAGARWQAEAASLRALGP